jgi:hypothetical protein
VGTVARWSAPLLAACVGCSLVNDADLCSDPPDVQSVSLATTVGAPFPFRTVDALTVLPTGSVAVAYYELSSAGDSLALSVLSADGTNRRGPDCVGIRVGPTDTPGRLGLAEELPFGISMATDPGPEGYTVLVFVDLAGEADRLGAALIDEEGCFDFADPEGERASTVVLSEPGVWNLNPPRVAALGAGRFVVVYAMEQGEDATDLTLMAQLLEAREGQIGITRLGEPVRLDRGFLIGFDVDARHGRVAVLYHRLRVGRQGEVVLQLFDEDLNPLGAPRPLQQDIQEVTNVEDGPAVLIDDAQIVAMWPETPEGSPNAQLFARLLDLDGQPLVGGLSPDGLPFPLAPGGGDQRDVRLARLPDGGGFLVLWSDGASGGLRMRAFDDFGTPRFLGPVCDRGELPVSDDDDLVRPLFPGLAVAADHVVVTWLGQLSADFSDVLGRFYAIDDLLPGVR